MKKIKTGTLRKSAFGVRAAARLLGCNHGHLSRVLRGQRVSVSLLTRYHQLQESK